MAASQTNMDLVIHNFVRNNYEENCKPQRSVPLGLKNIIVEFSKRIFNSKILSSHKEDLKFYKFIKKNQPWTIHTYFLFRASDNDFSAKKFHEKCDKCKWTLTLIKSNSGNIFGGCTSQT